MRSKRKLFYGCGYGVISTMSCGMWFFVDTGARGLENQSLFFFRGRGIGNPYVKGRESVASGQGGRHGGEGGRGLIYIFSTWISVPESFWVIIQKSIARVILKLSKGVFSYHFGMETLMVQSVFNEHQFMFINFHLFSVDHFLDLP